MPENKKTIAAVRKANEALARAKESGDKINIAAAKIDLGKAIAEYDK